MEQHGHAVAQAVMTVEQAKVPYQLLVDLVAYIVKVEARDGPDALVYGRTQCKDLNNSSSTGSVLIFLPGAEEIDRLVRMLAGMQ